MHLVRAVGRLPNAVLDFLLTNQAMLRLSGLEHSDKVFYVSVSVRNLVLLEFCPVLIKVWGRRIYECRHLVLKCEVAFIC